MPYPKMTLVSALAALGLAMGACSNAPQATDFSNPYATGQQYPWAETSVAVTAGLNSGYLSDQPWTTASNGWGPVERNLSNGEQNAGDGRTLKLAGLAYKKGLGVHAGGRITYTLNGACSSFQADVGLDDEVRSQSLGSVVFQVFADGAKLYDSGTMTTTTATKSVNVNLSGHTMLELVVTDAGDNNWFDHADVPLRSGR